MNRRQNYLAKQEMLQKNRIAAGLVSDCFPGVSCIVFRMTYYLGASSPILMERTLNFHPADYAYFRLDCMKEECTNGGFDLTSVVTSLVRSRKRTVKGKIMCRGKNPALPPGHASISYEVSVQYAKSKQSARPPALQNHF
jgi:hypothetical protein